MQISQGVLGRGADVVEILWRAGQGEDAMRLDLFPDSARLTASSESGNVISESDDIRARI